MSERSRRNAWLRDELILALELYRREGRNARLSSRQELSRVLRAIPVEAHLAADPRFRGPDAVALKLYNFNAIDPETPNVGMTRGGRQDAQVWAEYASDPQRLVEAAKAIRANLAAIRTEDMEWLEDDIAEAPEGRLLTRVHRTRERNRRLMERKKHAARAKGRLTCEACGFDFEATYGARGADFIECHHTVPLSTLKPNATTRLEDLVLLCSNCHRMVHRRAPWLRFDELVAAIRDAAASADPSGSWLVVG